MDILGPLFGLTLIAVILGGSICGLLAMIRVLQLKRQVEELGARVRHLMAAPPPAPAEAPARPASQYRELREDEIPQPAPPPEPSREEFRPHEPVPPPFRPTPSPVITAAATAPVSPAPPQRSFELELGTRWLRYLGIAMFVIGMALLLKYSYDSNMMGPKGRLAMEILVGLGMLGLGEHFRRKNWAGLFQTLTGGAIAVFYTCVYFSFQVYHFTNSQVAFGVAVLLTVLAIVMAVAHDALPIAIVAVLGGFASPVLVSTGENHPHVLFLYILILDLVALGAAYFRRWPVLDLICLGGTAAMYLGWFMEYYTIQQMPPALVYISIFYVLFLFAPLLHAFATKKPAGMDSLAILGLNSLFSVSVYYRILSVDHRQALGFVIVAQALAVFGLLWLWGQRISKRDTFAEGLLYTALALVMLAVPFHLKFYGIAIAWAAEAALFVYLGVRFDRVATRIGGSGAALLAVGSLFDRLPLHAAPFLAIANRPFMSWVCVIAPIAIAAYVLHRSSAQQGNRIMGNALALLAFALGCLLLTLEVDAYWRYSALHTDMAVAALVDTYRMGNEVVLWSLIPLALAWIILKRDKPALLWLMCVCYGIGAIFFLGAILPIHRQHTSPWLLLNPAGLPNVAYLAALFWGAYLVRALGKPNVGVALETTAHALLAFLIFFEIQRWGNYCTWMSKRMAMSLVSAGWALEAAALVWLGLWRSELAWRYTGFVMFGIAVAKTLFVDTQGIEPVYRIVSFLATGVLLLVATFLYQRYSALLIQADADQRKENAP